MIDSIELEGAFHEDDNGGPARSDAAANRLLLLKTAEELFSEHGVSDVNMAQIARAAGVGKGTLYRNFTNKGALCLALLDTQLQEFQDRQLAEMREMTAQGEPFLEQLTTFLESLVAFTDVHYPLLCEVQQHSETLEGGRNQRPHFWQYMTVHGLVRSAAAAGELPEGFDAAFAAEAILAPLAAQTFRFQREVLGFSTGRIAAGLRRFVDGLSRLEPAEQ